MEFSTGVFLNAEVWSSGLADIELASNWRSGPMAGDWCGRMGKKEPEEIEDFLQG
ncbi:hypothetical protein [Planctomicrobium sp. SH527]|uniref:hypothetical protein n=1 Tax=Planctomicrobium sp. SH527 TaxID=3448123 RepID=UPI003F5BCA02